MITLYVAGQLTTGCFATPGTPFDMWRWEQNVRHAEELMLDLSLAGFATYCPHVQNRFMFGRIPEPLALEVCFEWVRRSDALALVEGWQRSSGTLKEIHLARERGMMIFGEDCPFHGAARRHFIVQQVQEWASTRVTQPIDLTEVDPPTEAGT